ncbi:hypothetical protein C2G38_2202751 [Gigaspora rosea]|uniref:U1-type domain-containing protein n=1 Tax=Gigaspora rosea TaxID=44941 RepID=A0A397UNA0_9GLOM|nr:hypothetical protein C2G38_2202751 [Gigaspora rosea]
MSKGLFEKCLVKDLRGCNFAQEFLEDLFVDGNKLYCRFCNISIGWKNKSTVTTHINSKAHQDFRRSYVTANRNDRQQSFHTLLVVANEKKQIIVTD